MTVTRRAYNAVMNVSGTSTNTITVGVPTDTGEGDLMLAVTSQPTGTPTGTGPDGFELIGSFVSSTLQQSNLYRRIATDSEPANYTWDFTQTGSVGVALITFVGAHDILSWDCIVQTADSTPNTRRMHAARDAVAYSFCCWRDGATSTFTVNQGAEEFDVVAANTGSTIFRGITASYYGPGVGGLTDIVNIGDALPGTTWTSSGGALDHAINWAILIDNKAPDTEDWSSTNGDFAVELKLDEIAVDSLGSITTEFKGDVTGEVTAFFENGENPPNETTEMLVDGLASTKWLDFADASFVTYDFGSGNAKTIRRYRLTSANDVPDRDPYNWTLEGSNDNSAWTVLDTRTAESFGNRGEVREFKLNGTPGEYRYYKLNISSNRGPTSATSTQLAEFRLSTIDVWEDITTKVVEESKIRITRGLQGSSGRSDFTRAYVELNNTDGRFSLRNESGLYYGALQRNNQMRISKAYGTKSLQLQGDVQLEGTNYCGDGVRAALIDATQIEGDIDVRLDLELDSWRDEQMLCGISTPTDDPLDAHASWSLHLDNDGRLDWGHTDGSGTTSYVSTVAVPQATRQAIRVTVDVDNGSGGSTATFYTSDTIAGSWTQLGDTVTVTTETTSIAYEGGALCVGHVSGKDERGIHGMVYHFELRDGIGGTLVSDVDFTAQTNGAHEFEENGNRWVTVNNAVISNRRYRFHGEVAEWPLYWDSTGTWIATSVTGAGIQRRMERSNNPLSTMRRYHTKGIIEDPGAFERFATPYAYWPMEDHEDTYLIASGLPSKPGMQIYGTPLFDESDGDAFKESGKLIKLNGAKLGGRVSGNPTAYADIRWIMYAPTGPSTSTNFLTLYGTGLVRRWTVEYTGTNTWRIRGFDEDDTGTPWQDTGDFAVTTVGEPMHCRLILDYSGGTNVDVTFSAVDVFGNSLGTVSDTFLLASVGRIYRINVNDDDGAQATDLYMGHLALYGQDSPPFAGGELNSHHYETAGDRIKRLCDEESVEFRYSGSLDDTAFMGFQESDTPFAAMSSAAVSDEGYLVDPLDAFGIEYRTNRSVLNRAAHLALSYTSGELSGELRPVEDDAYIANDFTASRGDAGSSRFQQTDGPLSVNAPPDGVGPYEKSQSYSFAHEGQCVDMASWQVHKGTLDEERYPRIELALENLRIAADSALTERILLLDVGHRLDITDTPSFLPPDDIRQTVVGYEEWFDNFQHNFKLNTVPERWYEVAEYDSGYRFDMESSTLYQDVSAAASTIEVVNETGLEWSSAASDFDVIVDSERMTVTSVANASSAYTTDSFNRADSTTTPGSTDGGTAFTWSEELGTWGISSNQAYITASANSYMTIDVGESDFEEVSVDVTVLAATAEAWINFRYSDGNNRWRWGGEIATDARLEKVVAGAVTTYTPDVNGSDWEIAQGDTLMVRAHGSVIECFINGKHAITISDSFNDTATEVGLQTELTSTRFDNFTWISANPRQELTVTRGVGASTAKPHKSGAKVKLYQTPYRGI